MWVGECDDGVCEVIACEEPADNSDCLFVATAALAVDQDEAVHVEGGPLKSTKNYVGPHPMQFVDVLVENLRRNFALHQLIISIDLISRLNIYIPYQHTLATLIKRGNYIVFKKKKYSSLELLGEWVVGLLLCYDTFCFILSIK